MEQKCNVKILSSRKLTPSFKQNTEGTVWESIGLTQREAERVVAHAIKKMKENSEPLTITVTVN